MLAPVGRLKKKEIVWLGRHRCRHGHTYLEHYSCYLKENPLNEKIGFFDIEASNLNANFGIMLCYCIKIGGKDKILERTITDKELRTCLDKEVVKQCIKDLEGFDRIVTYYGKRFDFPFVRTRAVHLDIPFFNYGEVIHEDLYFNIKYKFKLHSNRLENACRVLLGQTDKTHIDPNHWLKALQGDKKSLNYIIEHCRYDVRDLEKLYEKVFQFTRKTDTSI